MNVLGQDVSDSWYSFQSSGIVEHGCSTKMQSATTALFASVPSVTDTPTKEYLESLTSYTLRSITIPIV